MSNHILSKSEDANPNYLAKITKVTNIRDHPNAERLNLCTIDGQTIIIGKDVKEGDVGVYFPLECIICHEFLSFCNLYRDKDLNKNKEANPGFFEIKYNHPEPLVDEPMGGRVKAQKLRGVVSEGFWIEISKLKEYIGEGYDKDPVDIEFDTINGEWFVKKYVPQQNQGSSTAKEGKKAKVSLIVPNQFRFHIDTVCVL